MAAVVDTPKGYAESKELRTKNQGILERCSAISKKALDEKRGNTPEENEEFGKLYKEFEENDTKIKSLERMADDTSPPEEKRVKKKGAAATEIKPAQYVWESEEQFATRCRRMSKEYHKAAYDYLTRGKDTFAKNERALQADVDISGGYLVLPEQLSNKILKRVDNILYILREASVIQVSNAQTLGVPSLDNDPDDGDWTNEIASIPQDNTMSYGKRSLTPTPLRKRLLVSERLLRMAMNAVFMSNDDANGFGGTQENIVMNRLAYKIAFTMEKAFMTGTGVGQPLGLFTASNRGISTSRDVNTGSATNVTYNGLVTIKLNQKAQYQTTSKWLIHRKFLELVMKLVDNTGRPLLDYQTLPNMPLTLLQSPILLSEFVPNVFTNNSYVGIYGDLTYYMAAISQVISMMRADELYAETAQVGFFISAEADGMPVQEEAFTRLKCGV